MEKVSKWAEEAEEIQRLLRLRGYIVSVKFLEKAEDVNSIPRIRAKEGVFASCQRFQMARMLGWTLVETKDNTPYACAFPVGLIDIPEDFVSGKAEVGKLCETEGDASKRALSEPRIPPKMSAVVISALFREACEPDVILIYGTPAQMLMILMALHWKDYEVYEFIDGGSSCASHLVRCYLTGKPALAVPDYGERRFGSVQEDEMVIALPPNCLGKVIYGIKGLRKTAGLPYPIPFFGSEAQGNLRGPKNPGE